MRSVTHIKDLQINCKVSMLWMLHNNRSWNICKSTLNCTNLSKKTTLNNLAELIYICWFLDLTFDSETLIMFCWVKSNFSYICWKKHFYFVVLKTTWLFTLVCVFDLPISRITLSRDLLKYSLQPNFRQTFNEALFSSITIIRELNASAMIKVTH